MEPRPSGDGAGRAAAAARSMTGFYLAMFALPAAILVVALLAARRPSGRG